MHGLRSGSVTLGRVPLLDLPLERPRTEVSPVTQEHHVFMGTVADNLRRAHPAATDAQVHAALERSTPTSGCSPCPRACDSRREGGPASTPAQAQQFALAG